MYRTSGDLLPFSRCRISAPFPIENSHLFSQYHVCFSQLRRKVIFFFFLLFLETTTTYAKHFFRDHYYLIWETMTHIRMILKHLCLSGMLGIIQSITWFWGYILLPLLCSMLLISPNFDVKLIIFSQFWPGAFSQNCWNKPWTYWGQGCGNPKIFYLSTDK